MPHKMKLPLCVRLCKHKGGAVKPTTSLPRSLAEATDYFKAKINWEKEANMETKAPVMPPVNPDEVEAPKGKQYCPMCEQPATIRKHYEKETYRVHGHNITVRQPISRCENCGDSWTNTRNDDDGLEKAYTIYTKRINPEARKFNKLYFKGSVVSALICSECMSKYKLPAKSVRSVRSDKTCSSKGCNSRSLFYRVLLGKV